MLPLSHDEVVYGKALAHRARCRAIAWQQFANLRLLFGYMWTPSRQEAPLHGRRGSASGASGRTRASSTGISPNGTTTRGLQRWVADLNRTYRSTPALHQLDFSGEGFQWVDMNDSDDSVLTYLRLDREGTTRARRVQLHADRA